MSTLLTKPDNLTVESCYFLHKDSPIEGFNFPSYLKNLVGLTAAKFKNHFGFALDSEKFYQDLSVAISEDDLINRLNAEAQIEDTKIYLYVAEAAETEEGYTFNLALGLYKESPDRLIETWLVKPQLRGVLAEIVQPEL